MFNNIHQTKPSKVKKILTKIMINLKNTKNLKILKVILFNVNLQNHFFKQLLVNNYIKKKYITLFI